MVSLDQNPGADVADMHIWVAVYGSRMPLHALVLGSYNSSAVSSGLPHLGIALGMGCLHYAGRYVEVHEEGRRCLETAPERVEC